jgi:AraC-like DNA-binding protein
MRTDDTHLILMCGGFSRCTPAWNKGKTGIDDCYKIYFPAAGSARIESDEGTHLLHPGRVFFISGFRLRRQTCERFMDVSWIHFVPESLYLRHLLDQFPPVVSWPAAGRESRAAARDLARLFEAPGRDPKPPRADAPPALACRVQGFLLGLLGRLLERIDDGALRRFNPLYYRLKPALDYMQAHARDNPPLREIAARAHLAPNYFHRRFRELLGTTPFDTLLAARLNMARRLLATTDLSVKEVADRAGYPNPLYFSRVFKSRLSLNPLSYRRMHRGPGSREARARWASVP